MLYNSVEFLALFSLTLLGAGHAKGIARQRLLLIASLVFYGSWSPAYLLLLITLILGNFLLGKWSQKRRGSSWLIPLACGFNLGLLAWFKYARFISDNLSPLLEMIGLPSADFGQGIVLPLAISFITFQGLAYVIDVSRGSVPAKNLETFALFLSFFPQLIAGPIVRSSELLPQLEKPRDSTTDELRSGLNLILLGFLKKCLIADHLGLFVDTTWSQGAAETGASNLVAAYAYTFQIYFDFSGYTDIGRGVARMLGIHLPENFDRPYMALGIRDFWRRWHMSLSRWLRDYLFISLGGSRGTSAKTYRNLLITMVLGGLWHGAAWGFILWGLLHGLALTVERWFHDQPVWRTRLARFNHYRAYRVAVRLLTFHLVLVGWILFRLVDGAQCLKALRLMIRLEGGWPPTLTPTIIAIAAMALIYFLTTSHRETLIRQKLPKPMLVIVCLAIGFTIGFGPLHNPFIYFQF
ncbi:MAG: hypothetical protein CMH58_03875 [Myxococcales bacterium]|nr:hypothetical protein [Myxococcales bacterium]